QRTRPGWRGVDLGPDKRLVTLRIHIAPGGTEIRAHKRKSRASRGRARTVAMEPETVGFSATNTGLSHERWAVFRPAAQRIGKIWPTRPAAHIGVVNDRARCLDDFIAPGYRPRSLGRELWSDAARRLASHGRGHGRHGACRSGECRRWSAAQYQP